MPGVDYGSASPGTFINQSVPNPAMVDTFFLFAFPTDTSFESYQGVVTFNFRPLHDNRPKTSGLSSSPSMPQKCGHSLSIWIQSSKRIAPRSAAQR